MSADIVSRITNWTSREPSILGAALIGSQARGTAQADSDIDIILVVEKPQDLLDDDGWVSRFGVPNRVEREDHGMVQSKRVTYEDGTEVEFGITTPRWLSAETLDEEKVREMRRGYVVLNDDAGLFARFAVALERAAV